MKRLILIAGAALLASTALSLADGDVDKGEKVFRKCKACHAVGEKAKNKVGPELNGIIGRVIASVEDYKYSSAMTEFGADGKVKKHWKRVANAADHPAKVLEALEAE